MVSGSPLHVTAMTEITFIPVHVLPHGEGLQLPAHSTDDSAGLDLRAAVPDDAPMTLNPGEFAMVPTGLQIALPQGMEAQVRPRSGLAAKHGVTVLNAPGTIDADYRGECKVILINHGSEPFTITRGERIAQLVVARYVPIHFEQVESLEETTRGAGGFGHTGRG